jgi:endoglucanase
MTAARRQTWIAPAVFGVVIAIAAGVFALTRSDGSSPRANSASQVAARSFLDRYVDADGRVVRRDQGGDSVSEGQAYGLLAAVGIGDRERFAAIWRWTQTHIEQRSGLFAWRWQAGKVADPQSAADADLDIARALALASWRFHEPSYRRAAARSAGALFSSETAATTRSGRVIIAGPWARAQHAVDPSYFSPAAEGVVGRATGDPRFQALSTSERSGLVALTAGGAKLPPDWATIEGGRLRPSGAPNSGTAPQYGLDAVRVPVHFAESCDSRGRALAAHWWRLLGRGDPGVQPRGLDGRPLPGGSREPAALVGAAAASSAAGARTEARRLLDQADALNRRSPTYYGSAWVALGRLSLTTRTLGGCPPLAAG